MAITYTNVYGISESGTNLIASLRLDNPSNTVLNTGNVTMTETGVGTGTLAPPPPLLDGGFTVDYEPGNQTNDGWRVEDPNPVGLPNPGEVYFTNQANVDGYEQGSASQSIQGQTDWYFAGQVVSIADVYVNASGDFYWDTPVLNNTGTENGLSSIPGGAPRPLPNDTNGSAPFPVAIGGSHTYVNGTPDANGWYKVWSYDQYIADLWSNTSAGANWNSSAVIMTRYSLSAYISTATGGVITQFPDNADFGYIQEGTVICFLADTLIETTDGPVPVQSLKVGDNIITDEGPVKLRFLAKTLKFLANADEVSLPICVPASSLGRGIPSQDLYVSPGHALLIDGNLIHASALVGMNGIHQVSSSYFSGANSFTYYNLELSSHRLITANNTPVESYFDSIPRSSWANYGEYISIYGADLPLEELALPRIQYQRQLPGAIRMKLQLVEESLTKV